MSEREGRRRRRIARYIAHPPSQSSAQSAERGGHVCDDADIAWAENRWFTRDLLLASCLSTEQRSEFLVSELSLL